MNWKKLFETALEDKLNLWVEQCEPRTSEILNYIMETYFAEYVDITDMKIDGYDIQIGIVLNGKLEEITVRIYI